MERRNTNLWPDEGLNHCFTDLNNWLVPKEVELPLVAGGWTGIQLCPWTRPFPSPASTSNEDHSSDLFGTELWILLRKGPVYKFISFSSQYIIFLSQCVVSWSGRHWELTGKASGWKLGCAKPFYVLGGEAVRNGFYEPHFPPPTWSEACHSRKSAFCCREPGVGIPSTEGLFIEH